MTALEKLQAESRERRMLMHRLKYLKKQKQRLEAKLFIEEVREPEYIKTVPVKKEKIVPPKPDRKIVIERIRKYVEQPAPEPQIDVEKIREFVNSKKPQVNKVYESAFSDKRDATRPPAKYSNRKAIDDYEF